MFFGGLFCAYLIYRRWYFGDFAAASTSIDALLGGTNTAVLICSSLTVVLAIWAAQTARRGLMSRAAGDITKIETGRNSSIYLP